jgi:hypothetical protein
VNFSHIPKFEILGVTRLPPLKKESRPEILRAEKKADQGMIRMEYELMMSVVSIGASWASSTTTWLTVPLARLCRIVVKTELPPLLGDGLVDGIRLGCDRSLGHT